MQKHRSIVVMLCGALLLGGCGDTSGPPSGDSVGPGSEEELAQSDGLPAAHPAFKAHFTHALYEDEGAEFAPFGSDEGWDLVMEWGERRDELDPDVTVSQLLELSDFAGVENEGDVDAATITIGAGFTVLRLTGQIDEAGRQHILRALQTLEDFYGPIEEVGIQRRDLKSWPN